MPTAPTRSWRQKVRPTAPGSGRGPTGATRATAACAGSAGMREPTAAVALAAAALVAAGCAGRGHETPTSRLVDGSAAPAPPAALASLGDGTVMSRVRVRRAG